MNELHPFSQFVTLLARTGFSHSLLLDLVMSPETLFLAYLVQTLKCMAHEWTEWTRVCDQFDHCTQRTAAKQTDSDNVTASHKRKLSWTCGSDWHTTLLSDSISNSLATTQQQHAISPRHPEHLLDCAVIGQSTCPDAAASGNLKRRLIVEYSSSSGEDDEENDNASCCELKRGCVEMLKLSTAQRRTLTDLKQCSTDSNEDIISREDDERLTSRTDREQQQDVSASTADPAAAATEQWTRACQQYDHYTRGTADSLAAELTDSDDVTASCKRKLFCADYSLHSQRQQHIADSEDESLLTMIGSCSDEYRPLELDSSSTARLRCDGTAVTTVDRVMSALSDLRRVLSRLVASHVFPFDIQPLLRLLDRCQRLYIHSHYTLTHSSGGSIARLTE